MRRWMLSAVMLLGCGGSPQGPFFDDQRYLTFGVDPDAEARALVERYEAAGRHLLLRVRGRHFTALGFDAGDGRPSAVRVVTVRGITLALDPPPADGLHDPVAYRLLAGPIEGTQDADRDGFEEVFVERLEGGARAGCIATYRVRDAGFVDPVKVDLSQAQGEGCIEDLRDVQADGRVEPWLVLRRGPLDPSVSLAVGLPLSSDNHRFVARPSDEAATSALTAQRGERELALQAARAAGDGERTLRAALELELIARLLGVPAAERARALTDALTGTPHEGELAALRARLEPPAADAGGATAEQQAPGAAREAGPTSGTPAAAASEATPAPDAPAAVHAAPAPMGASPDDTTGAPPARERRPAKAATSVSP